MSCPLASSLESDSVGKFRHEVIDEGTDSWQQAVAVGNQGGDGGVARLPVWEHAYDVARADFIAAAVCRQRNDTQTVERCLLQGKNVIAEQARREREYLFFPCAPYEAGQVPCGCDTTSHQE